MATIYKILILSTALTLSGSLCAQSHGNSKGADKNSQKNELNEHKIWSQNDRNFLDLDTVDYSEVFEKYCSPRKGANVVDCTQKFKVGKLRLAPGFFKTSNSWEDQPYAAPVNGILGNDFKRIEVYIYPDMIRTDSLTYTLRGRTKVKRNVCDFVGEVRIKKIYHFPDKDPLEDFYKIIAEYTFKENRDKNGTGVFRGIFSANGYIEDDAPGVIKVDERFVDGDGYENRTYVGTWQRYKNPSVVKRCVWGDYRLPFTFDFDIGDGEMWVNPKYASPEWDRYSKFEDIEYTETKNGKIRAKYKNPWW